MNIINTQELRRKLRAAVAMLLVSTILLMNSSYAWLVLATAPEVTGVTSVIGANGNLEIALATTEHLQQLQENDMYEPEGAEFVMANGDAVHDNVLWGNLVDVMSADYGLYTLDMRPAMLNVVDGAVAEVPVSLAGYGADGRMEAFDMDRIDIKKIGMSAVFDKEKARPVAGTVTMDRASLEAGIIDKDAVLQNLLDNVQYGVRVAGPLEYTGAYDLESENITVDLVVDGYCFALDLLVRTNAPVANLMLQTEGALRVQTDDELLLEEYQGQGSFIDLQNPLMTAALNVVFADTLTGKVYAVAQPNPEDGKLWITFRADENGELIPTPPEDSAMILPLTQNRVTALTAWVYLNGNLVQNASAMTQSAMELLMNLQFSTDAVLNPAYTDENAEQTYQDRPEFSVPTLPSVPGGTVDPSAPVNPSDPIEAGTFYLENKDNGHYSIYALDDNGSRTYDTEVFAIVNEASGALTVNYINGYSTAGIAIPAVVEDVQSGAKYDVKLNPGAFANVKSAAVPVHVLAVDGKKVEPTGTSLQGMFQYGAYTSIDLRGLDTSRVTSMVYMFDDCRSLTSLDVSGFDTGNVTSMVYMFDNCRSLTSLDLSGFDTGNVTDMSYMFYNCSSLTSLDLSGFDTGNVTFMGGMFYYCSRLTSLDLSGFDTGNVTSMYDMFRYCRSLTSLDLSGFDMTNVTDTEKMFTYCTALENIVSPKAMGTVSVELPASYRCAVNGSFYIHCRVLDQTVPAQSVLTKYTGGGNTEPSIPTEPSTPTEPSVPTEPAPTDTYYLEARNDGNYSIYRLNSDGSRAVDTGVSASVNASDKTVTVNSVKDCADSGIVIPAVVEDVQSGTTYDVKLNNSAFDSHKASVPVAIVPVNEKKVKPTGTSLYSMFAGSEYTSIDLRGLDTSSVTGMMYMFMECENLTSLDIGGLDTARVTNMDSMFRGCSRLTSLDVTSMDTRNVTDMDCMFYDCSSLMTLDVSGFDTGNVTDMGFLFNNCSGLINLDVGGFDTTKVTDMCAIFQGCSGLTKLDVTGFDTRNAVTISSMFSDCSGLTSIDVTGFDTGNVTNMGSVFSGCSGLTDLDVTNFKTDKVTNMRYMFMECSGLTSLDITGFDTGNVIDMYAMFMDCSGLTSLDVTGFNTGNVTDMRYMFRGCSSLTNLDVCSFDTANVMDMERMFSYCSGLTSLDVSGFDTGNVTCMERMFYNCSSLTSLDMSDWDTGNVTTMVNMFNGCSSLTSLNVSGWNNGNVTDMSYMFYDCKRLTSLDLSGFETGNVATMVNMFSGCSRLTSLDVSNFDTGNVTDMGYMFYGCMNLTSLDVSSFDTGNVTDMDSMFYGCMSLTSLDVSGFDTGNVTDMGYMFRNCNSLMSLDVSGFETGNVTDMASMFYGCMSLTSLDVSGWNIRYVISTSGMFCDCRKLTNLDISSWDMSRVIYKSNMFSNCPAGATNPI